MLLCLALFTCNDLRFIQVVAYIIGLFIFIDNNRCMGMPHVGYSPVKGHFDYSLSPILTMNRLRQGKVTWPKATQLVNDSKIGRPLCSPLYHQCCAAQTRI